MSKRRVMKNAHYGRHPMETYAKKHPACLQGALGFLSFDGFCCGERGVPAPEINGRPGLGFSWKVSCERAPTA
eukprot:5779452-Pyramimonas_sp.AAC.1